MASARERAQMNRLLGGAGLATLDDPRGMVQQLAFLVQDETHFRQLLTKCEPGYRRDMYESMKPNLGFPVKPLDVYMAEAGASAEARQLPTIGPDGQLRPYNVADIRTAQEAVDAAFAKQTLELTCKKCTKAEQFSGERKADAIFAARTAGWTYDAANGGSEICPECPVAAN